MGRWFTPQFHQAHPEKVDKIRASFLETAPQGFAACCAAIREMDQRESIKSISAKTLIVGGTKDAGTTPAMAEFMANAIPEAKLVLLEAAHLSNIERADEFNVALIEFLQGELAPPVTQA